MEMMNNGFEKKEKIYDSKTVEYGEKTIELSFLVEDGFTESKPTILRFSRYPNKAQKSYLIQDSLGYDVNIIDVAYVFKNLDDIYEEVISLINVIEQQLNTEVVGLELPFSDKIRLSNFFAKAMVGGTDLQILRPTFDEATKKRGGLMYRAERPVVTYEIFGEKFPLTTIEKDLSQEQAENIINACLLRYTQHKIQEDAVAEIRGHFGDQTEIVEHNSTFPSKWTDLLVKLKKDIKKQEDNGKKVVAIELIAPSDIMARAAYEKYFHSKGIKLIRPSFKKTGIDYVSSDGGDIFKFDKYNIVYPSFQFFSLLEPKDFFNQSEEQLGIRSNEEDPQNIRELCKKLDDILGLMSKEKWEDCLDKLSQEKLFSKFEEVGIKVEVKKREILNYYDLEKSNESVFDGTVGKLNIELLELGSSFCDEMKSRNMDIKGAEKALVILNVFAQVEELLHLIQQTGNNTLLSKEGQILYVHPYLQGNKIKQRNSIPLEGYSKEYLALEFDIVCIYKGFNIKIPPYIWHSYQRMDILHLILGENMTGVRVNCSYEKFNNIKDGMKRTIDGNNLLKFTQKKKIVGKIEGNHCCLERKDGKLYLSYPDNNWSGWGIFYLNEKGYWELVKEKEKKLIKLGDTIRIGPSVYFEFN